MVHANAGICWSPPYSPALDRTGGRCLWIGGGCQPTGEKMQSRGPPSSQKDRQENSSKILFQNTLPEFSSKILFKSTVHCSVWRVQSVVIRPKGSAGFKELNWKSQTERARRTGKNAFLCRGWRFQSLWQGDKVDWKGRFSTDLFETGVEINWICSVLISSSPAKSAVIPAVNVSRSWIPSNFNYGCASRFKWRA